jgi:hypothetical protein
VYNKQAEARDEALVKSWFSSLDSLLLFVRTTIFYYEL